MSTGAGMTVGWISDGGQSAALNQAGPGTCRMLSNDCVGDILVLHHLGNLEGVLLHLAIDGYRADRSKLIDEETVFSFLDEYPAVIGMTKVAPPQVYTYHGKVKSDWGVSGFVIIAESHMSVHTFPERRYLNIDIFSCEDFDISSSLDDVKDLFGVQRVKVWTMDRGFDYATQREGYAGMVRERVGLGAGRGNGGE